MTSYQNKLQYFGIENMWWAYLHLHGLDFLNYKLDDLIINFVKV